MFNIHLITTIRELYRARSKISCKGLDIRVGKKKSRLSNVYNSKGNRERLVYLRASYKLNHKLRLIYAYDK